MSPPGWLLVAAAVLALAAGWCANAEAALTLVAATGLAERPEHKGPLEAVAADLPRYMSVLLLLRAVLEIMAAVGVAAAFASWLGDDWRAFLAAVGTMIVLHYALTGVRPQLGRIGPRTERTAERAARFLHPLTRALGPLPRLLVAVGNALPPGGGCGTPTAASRATKRAPRWPAPSCAGWSTTWSAGPASSRESARWSARSSSWATPSSARSWCRAPTWCSSRATRPSSRPSSLALRSGFSRIPVVGENTDDVVGIAYLKDIVAWSHDHPGADSSEKVATVMRPASYVPDSKPVDELLRQMQAQRNHVAIVIDEYGGTAGLVTIEDILEEIVGEITDEYDNELPPVEWLSGGSARVTARLPVTELEELFGVRVEAEDVETVAGLLAHKLGRVPIAGSAATVSGLRLTAENLAGRRNKIGTVLVQPDGDEPQ